MNSRPPNPFCEVRNLSVTLNGREVLHEVSLSLLPGECLGVIGPNAAGKTSLIRALTGRLPAAGEIRIDGRPLGSWTDIERARRLSVIPADTPVPFAFTARELVAMARHPWSLRIPTQSPHTAAFVTEAMESADVLHLAERPATSLSSGERQRVFLARALAQQTPAILADEPFSHQDLRHAFLISELFLQLTRNGSRSVLCTVHDLNLAAEFCDRLLLLRDGKVLRLGTPEEVLQPDLLLAAYDLELQVEADPVSGRPRISTRSRHPLPQ